ncbi:MAG: glycoside hydrolase family 32 protein, partial [Verrucomicrobiales bacterium]|nr:glycoside hydrolase family 32 protein [Verrucomicrobiales bacterium]
WWTFDQESGEERTGRFPHIQLTGGAVVRDGRLVLNGTGATYTASRRPLPSTGADAGLLHYHLLHPGGDSLPGDPNAAFYLDGIYHLHYILAHPWKGGTSFSFVHVTSPDMLHWTWQPTKLQPSFTGHGMFSGTGFLTKEGRPAAIYHGQASGRNQIALATDRKLSAWEKPYPVSVRHPDGTEVTMNHWDPDCFLIGDTYYAISGGENPPLMKSKDLQQWTRVGDFLRHDLPDVARGEDISCPNFFPLGNQWMLLCISHDLGCRYYLGDWDAKAEQFVPRRHGRMNWRRESQSLFSRESWRADFFAPESVLTPDGRRVMWAWCATVDRSDGRMSNRTLQSLPRELSLPADGDLRIRPLRELESLRYDPEVMREVAVTEVARTLHADRAPSGRTLFSLGSEAMEIRIQIERAQAERKLFGFTLFAEGKDPGLPIVFRPETGALRVGTAEAPFSIAELPAGEDVDLRIFVDRYVVEVFVNDRQAILAAHLDSGGKGTLSAFSVGAPTTLKTVQWWKMRPTNQGFLEAQKSRVWEPATQ